MLDFDELNLATMVLLYLIGFGSIAFVSIFAYEVWSRYDAGHSLGKAIKLAWRSMI